MASVLDLKKCLICLLKIFLLGKFAFFVPIARLDYSILQNVKFAKEGTL